MNTTAHINNKTNCYACAHMPLSTHSSGLWPYSITESETVCLLALATHPGVKRTWNTANFSIPLNLNGKIDSPVAGKVNCSGKTDLLTWPQVPDPLPDIILLNKLEAGQLPMCFKGNGSAQVGDLPWHLCNVTYSFCPRLNRISCLTCLKNARCANDEIQRAADCAFDTSYQMTLTEGRQDVTKCSTIAPTPKGTRVLADWYFLCGHKAYPSLPAKWGGLCTLVKLSDHVFFMERIEHHPGSKTKRDVQSASTKLTDLSEVPWEFRIWGPGAKFLQGLFPWIGVGKVGTHVEINRYALLRHINWTQTLGTALAEEQKAIRTMVLQNRLTLDLITASQGGVCKLIGETCCTYIPDGYTSGGDIYEALQNLTTLQKYMMNSTPGVDAPQGWMAWLLSGPWWHLLLKVLTPVFGLLILICLCIGCILPCIRSLLTKMISDTFVNYVLLQQYEMTEITEMTEACV